jgi:hypothetical protein
MRRLAAILAIPACTYGPPHLDTKIENHAISPDSQLAAYAVHSIVRRPPTGLSAWPDGGVAKVLAEAGAVYVCDAKNSTIRRLWRGDRPDSIRSAFSIWLGPWTTDGIYFSLRGEATPTTTGSSVRLQYRINPRGGLDSGVVEPPLGAATPRPTGCDDAVRQAATADPPARVQQ